MILEVSHPTQDQGKIAGFKYFWAYYVDSYRPDKHCQECFIGAPVPQFNSTTAQVGVRFELDKIDKHAYVYVCGFASGPKNERYRKNFHLALRHAKGRSVSAETHGGYVVTAQNAVMLQIPTLPRDLLTDAQGNLLPEEHIRCRNYQFAVEVFEHAPDHSL